MDSLWVVSSSSLFSGKHQKPPVNKKTLKKLLIVSTCNVLIFTHDGYYQQTYTAIKISPQASQGMWSSTFIRQWMPQCCYPKYYVNWKLSKIPWGKKFSRELIFANFFFRYFAGINFREFDFTEDFAGINFRELSLTKDFAKLPSLKILWG